MALRSQIKWLAAFVVGALFLVTSASAIELRHYSAAEFEAAQSAGTPIIVDIFADWCPTCQAQRRVIRQLADDPRFAKVVVFEVDYDTEKNIMRQFSAPHRSTLIGFKGSAETDRLIAVTRFEAIEALLLSIVE